LRLRTIALSAILIVLIGLLGFVFIRYTVSARSSVDEWIPARTIPNTDVNPYGANFFLAREVEPWKRERTVEMAAEAGLGWAKQEFSWAEIEPLRKGEFIDPVSQDSSWAKFDQIVDLFRDKGLQVIARLDRAPAWARPIDSRAETPPTDFADFGDFVYAFVKHFSGRIQYIQIWNEPNIYPEWGEQAVDPAAYYLEAMYSAGAGGYFDILSANAFGFDQPPDSPPDPNALNFRRVELQRKIMDRYGDDNKAIWFNEYGWNAAPDSFSDEALIWKNVSEEQQAEYTLQGIELARTDWPWAGAFNIWYFRQTGQQYTPAEAAYYFRMVDVDFTPRRVYDAVQDATRPLFVAPPGHFEETNPAVVADAGWRGIIAAQASGQAYYASSEPGASLTFTFQGHSVDLIAHQIAQSGRLLVTLDGHNIDGLPVDNQGRSYLDLSAAQEAWQARLPIAAGLTLSQHVVRLTVSETEPTSCNVDAFEVNAAQPPGFPTLLAAGLGLGSVLAAVALAWDMRSRPRREKFF
jgi:hypothetical protein